MTNGGMEDTQSACVMFVEQCVSIPECQLFTHRVCIPTTVSASWKHWTSSRFKSKLLKYFKAVREETVIDGTKLQKGEEMKIYKFCINRQG